MDKLNEKMTSIRITDIDILSLTDSVSGDPKKDKEFEFYLITDCLTTDTGLSVDVQLMTTMMLLDSGERLTLVCSTKFEIETPYDVQNNFYTHYSTDLFVELIQICLAHSRSYICFTESEIGGFRKSILPRLNQDEIFALINKSISLQEFKWLC